MSNEEKIIELLQQLVEIDGTAAERHRLIDDKILAIREEEHAYAVSRRAVHEQVDAVYLAKSKQPE